MKLGLVVKHLKERERKMVKNKKSVGFRTKKEEKEEHFEDWDIYPTHVIIEFILMKLASRLSYLLERVLSTASFQPASFFSL